MFDMNLNGNGQAERGLTPAVNGHNGHNELNGLSGHAVRRRLDLTVIIPTRNETDNISALLGRLAASGDPFDVLFVDDSDDSTPDEVRRCAAAAGQLRVQVLHRPAGERGGGLGGAVLAGMRAVRTSWVVVMDADLQHPPELAVRLAAIGRDREADLVVASRYVGSGAASGLDGRMRHAVSEGTIRLAKLVFPIRLGPCSDPMSGFFAVRRDALKLDTLTPNGFKILMEILVRHPKLRMLEVSFVMASRLAGESKASQKEGLRFANKLVALRLGTVVRPIARSAAVAPTAWLARVLAFGLAGLSGLVVNTGALWMLNESGGLHYLLAAALATQVSSSWLFLLTDAVIFRRAKPGTLAGRAAKFFLLNNVALVARLPALALLVEVAKVNVLVANLVTLLAVFAVRFAATDVLIYRRGVPTPAAATSPENRPVPGAAHRQPIREVVDLGTADASVLTSSRPLARYLPYRYVIPEVASVGSQIELPELDYFRAQWLGNEAEIELRVGPTGDRRLHRRAQMTQLTEPPAACYQEHFGRLGANFTIRFDGTIQIVVSPRLARSPHVVYTNVLEALLRFVAVSRGVMLLHSACVEFDGHGMLISARTDTGKTGTVLRLVREYGARFLADDMTIVHSDGTVGCFPKPLTISRHTVQAIESHELTSKEWRRLRVQSAIHSKEGREFAILLSRLNVPIMAINAYAQRLVPPPKYAVDRLLPCQVIRETTVRSLFIIERGPFSGGEVSHDEAVRLLLSNTEDAYQFPPFRQLSPSIVLGADDHVELRRKEEQILRSAMSHVPVRRVSTPDFSWAPEIARLVARNGNGNGGVNVNGHVTVALMTRGHVPDGHPPIGSNGPVPR
ncbi:MAG TPA: glycosyltransferase [Pseudonocardiaceae bacterium]